MYGIRTKSNNLGDQFEDLIQSLPQLDKRQLMTTLSKYPKSNPMSSRTEQIGRVEKKGKFWQYYLSNGWRIIYDVMDRPKLVIINFIGNHEEA